MKNHILTFLKKCLSYFPVWFRMFIEQKYRFIYQLYTLNVFPILIHFKQRRIVNNIKTKPVLKVVFLAIHKSVWKVDPVFQKMLKDPYFEPIILVVPFIQYGHERMLEDLSEAYKYFESKGYPVLNSYNEENDAWLPLRELEPDIVWFTNPHNLTRSEYYSSAYKNYLSIYVPYYFMATNHAGDSYSMYGSQFLNAAFRVFWPSQYHLLRQLAITNGFVKNGIVSGYPSMEGLLLNRHNKIVWKIQDSPKKKIIFAPHHTIEGAENSLSSFLNLASFMKKMAEQFSDQVQWSFKPHPILKSKLFKNEDWGKERTEEYFRFWAESDFSQLDEDEYDDLFLQSDAIIHDSSSFISEYVFTGKPGLYLMQPKKADLVVNDFGKMFLSHYLVGDKPKEIEDFVVGVINGKLNIPENQKLKNYTQNYYIDNSPTDLIIQEIKKSLSVKNL